MRTKYTTSPGARGHQHARGDRGDGPGGQEPRPGGQGPAGEYLTPTGQGLRSRTP